MRGSHAGQVSNRRQTPKYQQTLCCIYTYTRIVTLTLQRYHVYLYSPVMHRYHRGNYPGDTRTRHLCAFCIASMSVPGISVRSAHRWRNTRDIPRVYLCRNTRVLIQVRVPPLVPYTDTFESAQRLHPPYPILPRVRE